MRTLSESERLLVEANVNLVYHVTYSMIRAGKLQYRSIDDAIGEGMLGLVKAAQLFDPERGTQFSTLAVKSIRMHILNMIDREITQVKYRACSLDVDISEGSGEHGTNKQWAESIPSDVDVESDAVNWLGEVVREICSERQASMLLDNVNGHTINEIALDYGVTPQRVSKQICDAKWLLKKHLNRDDWR